MIKLNCKQCNKEMLVQGVMGSVPLQIPFHNYCSEQCLAEAHEKNKIK
jgi:hypothetical protein